MISSAHKIKVDFVTSSSFKIAENYIFAAECSLNRTDPVSDRFEFEIRQNYIKEVLEVDLEKMVVAEVTAAYATIKVPCIVEHAGLVFDGFEKYPGGLTKPMWNELGDDFLKETHSAGRRAKARAVIAYCDGRSVQTFTGETSGVLSDLPKGSSTFYWDTIFIPDTTDPAARGKTYAEIVDEPALGLRYKMEHLSQSSKAMRFYLEYRLANHPDLWPRLRR